MPESVLCVCGQEGAVLRCWGPHVFRLRFGTGTQVNSWECVQVCPVGTPRSLCDVSVRKGALGATLGGLQETERPSIVGCLSVRQEAQQRSRDPGIFFKITKAKEGEWMGVELK